MWPMQFNIDKCFILRVGRPQHKLVHSYTPHNQNLSETDSAKYLGLTITSDLQWNQHIYIISGETSIFAPQRLRFYEALGVPACTVGKVRASTVFMCVCSMF